MKWFFILWVATAQSLGGPFDDAASCVRELDMSLGVATQHFGYPEPAGICFEGVARRKSEGK